MISPLIPVIGTVGRQFLTKQNQTPQTNKNKQKKAQLGTLTSQSRLTEIKVFCPTGSSSEFFCLFVFSVLFMGFVCMRGGSFWCGVYYFLGVVLLLLFCFLTIEQLMCSQGFVFWENHGR